MAPALLSALLLLAAGGDEPKRQADDPALWDRDYLTGDWGGMRARLGEQGLSLTLAYTGEVLSNVHGGIDTGTRYEGLFDIVLDADLGKAAGWSGATARVNPFWIEGQGLTRDHTADLTKISNIDARDEVRLFEAWVQQAAFEGTVSLRAGLLAADQEFVLSNYSSLFVNGTFGMPVVVSVNEPVAVYPLGALGVRLRADPGAGFYVQAAVYEGHTGAEHFNETGLRIRLRDDEGTVSVVEAGWVGSGEHPGAIKAGVFVHRGDFVDHDSGEPERGHHVVYLVAERLLFREPGDEGACPQGLGAFVRLGGAPEDRSNVEFYADAGLHYTGLIPGRDLDVLGLAAVYARLSGDFIDVQPVPSDWDHEIVVEATYKVVLTKWFSLQPDFQYVIHPGGTSKVDDAFVVGLRFDLLF
jgi:porin